LLHIHHVIAAKHERQPDWSVLVYFSHHLLSTAQFSMLGHFPERIVSQLVAREHRTSATFIELVASCEIIQTFRYVILFSYGILLYGHN